ncbi:Testis-expressed sequence 10 protein [Trichoplax sp. H2]|nr:Testis-expressed sequence 10 protein [Trichoplax sp. H2]|eukprot:RDD40971.1 Testis-expressed sequence 10 protein [Trichoplax sp. H2]
MGKSSKKKKEKMKDFVKPKLKVGRKLQKQNATQTSFKTLTIALPNQHQASHEEPLSQRKQPLQVLLSQLRHYNANVRHDALAGIKDILSSHVEYAISNLSPILGKITECMTDIDARVRHELFIILKHLLCQLSLSTLQPFFASMVARLCCGLTHIDYNIRIDTLKILDILLDHFPGLVARHSRDLLPIIVDIISQQCNTTSAQGLANTPNSQSNALSQAKSETKQPSRALTVRLRGKLNIHEIRHKVLHRLRRFLTSLYRESYTDSKIEDNGTKEYDRIEQKSYVKFNYHTYSQQATIKFNSPPDFSTVFVARDEFKQFIDTIMPLLTNIWLECNPSKLIRKDTDGDKLLEILISLMEEVLLVMQLLCQVSREQHEQFGRTGENGSYSSVTLEKYFNDIEQNIFGLFPLTAIEVKKGRKSNSDESKSSDKFTLQLLNLNLIICDIMVYFINFIPLQRLSTCEHIVSFAIKALKSRVLRNAHGLIAIAGNLLKSLSNRSTNLGKGKAYVIDIVEAIRHYYGNSHEHSNSKIQCLKLLQGLLEEEQINIVCGAGSYIMPQLEDWLISLPQDILRPEWEGSALESVSIKIIKSCLLSGLHNQTLLMRLNELLIEYFDSATEKFLKMPTNVQRHFIEILYFCEIFHKQLVKALASRCHALDKTSCNYMLDILFDRYDTRILYRDVVDFLSIIFPYYLKSYRFTPILYWNRESFICDDSELSEKEFWERHCLILEHTAWQLRRLHQHKDYIAIFKRALLELLNSHPYFPIQTAMGMLKCLESLKTVSIDQENSFNDVTLWAKLMFSSVYAVSNYDTELELIWQPALLDLCITILRDPSFMTQFLKVSLSYIQESDVNEVIAISKVYQRLLGVFDLHDSLILNRQLLKDLLTAMKAVPGEDKMSYVLTKLDYDISLITAKS